MTRSEVEPTEGGTNDRDAAKHADRIRKGDASMAYGLIDVVTKERIEAAVDRTLRLHAQRTGNRWGHWPGRSSKRPSARA